MKVLYLDCGMGAAGDMLTAALLELLPEPEEFIAELNALGILGVEFKKEKAVKCGVGGTHLSVAVHGVEEGEDMYGHDLSQGRDSGSEYSHDDDHIHGHSHEHECDYNHSHTQPEHSHHHHHSSLRDIEKIVLSLPLPKKVQTEVLAVYGLIAEAESHAHGVPVVEIHFHEVGAMDAVADVTAVCLLMSIRWHIALFA